jgi:hypothetical protein
MLKEGSLKVKPSVRVEKFIKLFKKDERQKRVQKVLLFYKTF